MFSFYHLPLTKKLFRDLRAKIMLVLALTLILAMFITSETKNALVVPRGSVIQDSQGQYHVYLVKKKKLLKTDVKIGVVNDSEIQILAGLKNGDAIEESPTI